MDGKVLLLGNRRAMPPEFPLAMPENAGNMIHADAAFRIVRNGVFHTREWPASADVVRFVERECSHVVYIFANALRLGDTEPRQFAETVKFLEATTKPVIAFGLGAQADSTDDHAAPLPEAAIRMLQLLSNRCHSIGVRGAFTERVLRHHGIDNVRITGCPSLYSNLSPDFPLDTGKEGAIAFAGTHFFREQEAALLGFAIRHGFQHVEPVSKLLYEAHAHLSRRELEEDPNLPYFVRGLIKQGAATETQAITYLLSHFNMFWDMPSWRKFNRERISFTYGTRFHVNMAALISGVPALWVVHDARTRELADFMSLPHVSIDEAAAAPGARRLAGTGRLWPLHRRLSGALRQFQGLSRRERAASQPAMSAPVDIAVIVPVWGQGPLLCESIASVLNQRTDARVAVLLMDDACPEPQTVKTCRRFARAHPDRVLYWRSPQNRGLAAMRNEGADLALRTWPDLHAILSFDGDDRMHPRLLQRAWDALRRAEADNAGPHKVGWVFEDPDHFGQDGVLLRTHRYSALWSMAGCANCPTSLTHADVYRAGIRFREDMKSGSEDWQFWLTCLAHGFRGVFAPDLGFRYRRRPGSMSVGALALAESNKVDIRLSRRDIYHPDFFLAEEARELPRYVLVEAEGTCRVMRHAADRGRQVPQKAFLCQIADYVALPTTGIPQNLISASRATLALLRGRRLLDWALWRLEDLARTAGGAALWFEGQADDRPALRLIPTHRMADTLSGKKPIKDLLAVPPAGRLRLPLPAPRGGAETAFRSFLADCAAGFPGTATPRPDMVPWRPFGLRYDQLSEAFFGIPTLLAGEGLTHQTAFVVEVAILDTPDVAKELATLATGLRGMTGQRPSLVVIGGAAGTHDPGPFARLLYAGDKGSGPRRSAGAVRDADQFRLSAGGAGL